MDANCSPGTSSVRRDRRCPTVAVPMTGARCLDGPWLAESGASPGAPQRAGLCKLNRRLGLNRSPRSTSFYRRAPRLSVTSAKAGVHIRIEFLVQIPSFSVQTHSFSRSGLVFLLARSNRLFWEVLDFSFAPSTPSARTKGEGDS